MANQQTLNILVVDSEEEARVQLKSVLTEQGFGVTSLSEPLRAPEEVRQNRFQMIVLDVSPGSGGTDAAAIQLARSGSAAMSICIPTRYVHSVVETVHVDDVKATIDLLAAFLETASSIDLQF